MRLRWTLALVMVLCAASGLSAQELTFADHTIQFHGFFSEGFIKSNSSGTCLAPTASAGSKSKTPPPPTVCDDNFLTMNTSHGAGDMTEAGFNASTNLTDRFRVGAQVYVRNEGHLGDWHPMLDWGYADYKFADWFGIRGGKVKTALGLYTDTQDMEFLHTWALLPQSTYPVDLRGDTIAHTGGDIYGNLSFHKAGSVAYTAYAGQRDQDMYGGITYGLLGSGIQLNSYGGTMWGGDLRWTTPVKNLMAGASYVNLNLHEDATRIANQLPYTVRTNKDRTPVFYTEYTIKGLRFDGEYRHEDKSVSKYGVNGQPAGVAKLQLNDIRSSFVSAAYRFNNWLEAGTYHSWYYPNYSSYERLLLTPTTPLLSNQVNHIFDQAITVRLDPNPWWDVKAEVHFMDGVSGPNAYHGFYTLDNPKGLSPNTTMLVLRTGFHF